MEENQDLLLSIIVPVYNVEKYVRPCIESIYQQNLDDNIFEVIIVNDGTEDRSMEMIQDIIEQHKNITIINQENQGLSVARNNGIAAAKGEYILMPDSDDLLIEGSLKPLLEIAIKTRVDTVVADYLKLTDEEIEQYSYCPSSKYEQVEMTGLEYYINKINPNELYIWHTLYRRDFIRHNNLKFYPGIYFQDVPFTQECYLKAKKIIKTNRLLNIYRRGHQSASAPSSFKKKNAQDFCIAIAQTWKLRNMQGFPAPAKKKHMDCVFTLYTNLLYRTLYAIKGTSSKVNVLKYLKNEVPDLQFTNGIKQKVASFMFKHATRPAILLLLFRKKYITRKKQQQKNSIIR